MTDRRRGMRETVDVAAQHGSERHGATSAILTAALVSATVAVTTFVMSVFEVGIGGGLLSAAAAFLVYSVPATLFDWPRVTADDLIEVGQTAASRCGLLPPPAPLPGAAKRDAGSRRG